MKKLQFIDIGKPFRIIGKICKDIERAFRFKGINVNFIVMMIDYIGFAFILKWNLQLHVSVDEFFLPANNLVKSTRRLQIEKYMDSFTDKELSLMESLASGINEARNIED